MCQQWSCLTRASWRQSSVNHLPHYLHTYAVFNREQGEFFSINRHRDIRLRLVAIASDNLYDISFGLIRAMRDKHPRFTAVIRVVFAFAFCWHATDKTHPAGAIIIAIGAQSFSINIFFGSALAGKAPKATGSKPRTRPTILMNLNILTYRLLGSRHDRSLPSHNINHVR